MPLRVNPEQSFDFVLRQAQDLARAESRAFAQDRPEQAKRVEGQAPSFRTGSVEGLTLLNEREKGDGPSRKQA